MENNEIQGFYDSLDETNSLLTWEVQKTIVPINSKIEKDIEWKIIAERKVLYMQYDFQTGKLDSSFHNLDVHGHPVFQKFFNSNEIEYLNNRIDETKSIFLKAKYSHLLWQETKHLKYATSSMDYYFELVRSIESTNFDNLKRISSALIHISSQTKKQKKEVKIVIQNLIEISPHWIKYFLIKLLSEDSFLEKLDYEKYIIEIATWQSNYFSNIQYYELGINLCSKNQQSGELFYYLLAQNENLILEQHPSKEDFLHISTLGKKCKYLQNTTHKLELEKCLIQYNDAKKYVKLNKISLPVDEDLQTLFNDYIKFKSQFILTHSTDEILAFFSLDEDLLVNKKSNEENAKKNFNNSIHSLYSVISLDINLNTKQLNETEKLLQQQTQNYGLEVVLRFHSLFYITLINGIIQGKLNYILIHNFLEKNTWYGNKFKRELKNSEIENDSNWVSLIAPSLHNFFTQFELSVLLDENKVNNFILCLDSLTLKFEGALRDFIRLCGGSTSTVKQGILQELLLEDLLKHNKVIELFSANDIELFKYTFTKNGINLRNNIAHSFMSYSNYSLQNVSIVLLCFLRLGKYEFIEEK